MLRAMIVFLLCGALVLGVYAMAEGRPDLLVMAVLGVIGLTLANRVVFTKNSQRSRADRVMTDRNKAAHKAVAANRKAVVATSAPIPKAPAKPVVRRRGSSQNAKSTSARRRVAARA